MKYNFTKITIFIVLALLILITLFVYLGSLRRNHIRQITVSGSENSSEYINTKINIKFSRPVNKENIKQFISITPEIEFSAIFIQNDLQILFNKNLNSSQKYLVKLNKEIKDVYQQSLENDFEYEFTTKEQKIIFIKKDINKKEDKIIESSKDFSNQNILFQSENIKSFNKDKNNLFVVTINSDKTQNIFLKDLENNTFKDFKLDKQNIYSIDLFENYALFVSAKVEPKSGFLVPQGKTAINIYNLESGELKTFNPKETALDSTFAKFSDDGKSIIYKSSDSFFYIAGLENNLDPVGVGRFQTTGGFNKKLDKIVFTEFDPLQTYSSFPFISVFSSDRQLNNITNGENFVVDPQFFKNSDSIIFSQKYKDLEGSTGLFSIFEFDGSKFIPVLENEFNSLEIPKMTYDDKYFVVEKYSTIDLLNYEDQRDFVNYRKPLYADLLTYDLEQKKIIGECENCIEAEWKK